MTRSYAKYEWKEIEPSFVFIVFVPYPHHTPLSKLTANRIHIHFSSKLQEAFAAQCARLLCDWDSPVSL